MKRFWLVLLALGMLFAFSSSVFAADVKFTGSFYAAGMYQDKTSLIKDSEYDTSTAFYYQRLRVGMYFVVTPALSLVTRFDAMERAWGAPRTAADTVGGVVNDVDSAGTVAENENIAFDWAYIQYVSPIGMFQVGYQQDGAWGTVFGDNSVPLAKIQYVMRKGPITGIAYMGKIYEGNRTAKNAGILATDVDADKYMLGVVYAASKDLQAGLLFVHIRDTSDKAAVVLGPAPFTYLNTKKIYTLQPYFKAKFGPVALEGELQYFWGDIKATDTAGGAKVKLDMLSVYLDAVADLGMFYAGGTFAYLSGDKDATLDGKLKGGLNTGGIDWNPTLILFNYDKRYWAGSLPGYNAIDVPVGTDATAVMSNAWFFQGRAGVRPVPALNIMASLTYAFADKKADFSAIAAIPAHIPMTKQAKDDYGWELDVTATYAITNNLSYMLGVGYLWTGDYYKGSEFFANGNKLQDDYLVINKLTLTF